MKAKGIERGVKKKERRGLHEGLNSSPDQSRAAVDYGVDDLYESHSWKTSLLVDHLGKTVHSDSPSRYRGGKKKKRCAASKNKEKSGRERVGSVGTRVSGVTPHRGGKIGQPLCEKGGLAASAKKRSSTSAPKKIQSAWLEKLDFHEKMRKGEQTP